MIRPTVAPRPGDDRPGIRRPRQKRSQQRFEAILDAAERLLQTCEPAAVSVYALADEAQMSPPSIYHFFSDADQVLLALAERIQAEFVALLDTPPPTRFSTWQELSASRFEQGRQAYNSNIAARRLLLGSGMSAAIRARDLETDRQVAIRSYAEFQRYFLLPDTPEMVDRFTELLVVNDALWALSVHRHGIITDAFEEQARRARVAYARTFLPEYLPMRSEIDAAA